MGLKDAVRAILVKIKLAAIMDKFQNFTDLTPWKFVYFSLLQWSHAGVASWAVLLQAITQAPGLSFSDSSTSLNTQLLRYP